MSATGTGHVYAPQADTHLLVEALADAPPRAGADVLDMCTGSGVLALAAARHGTRVTAVDMSARAVTAARDHAERARAAVHVVHGDLFAPVNGREFDLILSNPPYVPAPEHRPRHGRALAWDAGPDGRAVLDRICAEAPHMLRSGGSLLLVQSALCGTSLTLGQLRRQGLRAEVVRRRRIPFGPVMSSRAAWLTGRGLISAADTTEELVIIRAERAR